MEEATKEEWPAPQELVLYLNMNVLRGDVQ